VPPALSSWATRWWVTSSTLPASHGQVGTVHQIGGYLGAADRRLSLQGLGLIACLANTSNLALKLAGQDQLDLDLK